MRAKRKIGNVPPLDKYELVGELGAYGAIWHLYLRVDQPHEYWANFKIVAAVPVDTKSNYWMSWNFVEGRCSSNISKNTMDEHSPDLLSAFETFCESFDFGSKLGQK